MIAGYVERRFIILRDCQCASAFTLDDVQSLDTAFTKPPSIVLCQLKLIYCCLEYCFQRAQHSRTREDKKALKVKWTKIKTSFLPPSCFIATKCKKKHGKGNLCGIFSFWAVKRSKKVKSTKIADGFTKTFPKWPRTLLGGMELRLCIVTSLLS